MQGKQKTLSQEGVRKLVMAICQQWINDGKPKDSEESIKGYAKLLHADCLRRTWYKTGVLR